MVALLTAGADLEQIPSHIGPCGCAEKASDMIRGRPPLAPVEGVAA